MVIILGGSINSKKGLVPLKGARGEIEVMRLAIKGGTKLALRDVA